MKHKLHWKWGHIVSYVTHLYSRVDFYSSLEVNLSLYYGGVDLCYLVLYSLAKHHVHARFCIVNSMLAQSVRIYNDLIGQRTNTPKLNWLFYNVKDIW